MSKRNAPQEQFCELGLCIVTEIIES